MHIDLTNIDNVDHVCLCESDEKAIVNDLGVFSELADGKPDYLERLQASFERGKPLLPELECYTWTNK